MANGSFDGTAGGRGSIDDLPWATVFDPAANARALGAIQSEGFRAASALVDRFARAAADADRGHRSADSSPGLEQLTRTWWSTFGRMLLGGNGAGAFGGADLDLGSPENSGGLRLATVAPGQATAEVWLHNRGTSDFGDVRLRCSDLTADDGAVLTSGAVRLLPETVAMPGRCSRGVTVEVDVQPGLRPAIYRGNLLVGGHPEVWLPVALTVSSPQP